MNFSSPEAQDSIRNATTESITNPANQDLHVAEAVQSFAPELNQHSHVANLARSNNTGRTV